MKTNATSPTVDRTSAVAAPLQIVLAYDQPLVAREARNLIAGYLKRSAPDSDMHRDEWSFAELEHPKFRSEALELASQCELFVIALSGSRDIPESFLEWAAEWMQTRAEVDAVMIVCVGSENLNPGKLPLCAALSMLARENGVSFLATAVDVPASVIPADDSPKALLARLAAQDLSGLPESWGIND